VPEVPEQYECVRDEILEKPWTFHFFQAIRLLERMQPDREPLGGYDTRREVVKFTSNTNCAFPASQIQALEWKGETTPTLVINFMGLTGPQGVLPLYYSEMIYERVRAKDRALHSFLDIFNHRLISLFYAAWEKYRFQVAYERGERDRISQYLMDLIGLGTKGLHDRQAIPDDALLFYSGLLGLHTRSVSALRAILIDYFDVPVEVEQFVGSWYTLSRPDQCSFEDDGSFSEQLGVGVVVGDEIWDQQSGLRIVLGPLSLEQYMDFLPEGSGYIPLQGLTRFFAGQELDFEVQLVLKRAEVPPCELDETVSDPSGVPPRLGWTTWAKTIPMTRDPGDAILRI
jgi:type VI secretion system protein ImpH